MKIGDQIYSTKVRPNDIATVIKADVKIVWRELKNGTKKKETQTKYVARYDDLSYITFYGFDINRTVFKREATDGQLSLFDILD